MTSEEVSLQPTSPVPSGSDIPHEQVTLIINSFFQHKISEICHVSEVHISSLINFAQPLTCFCVYCMCIL